ncbi:nucleoside recognition domain-containing protein [Calorimonas adulescens]|uniref:Nucleoside recognition protein n=1 Tax=Calorimonas adulescens TaxID=2606906 RepID=A0A5D8QDK8_9THEO|nr:nucleoside recognition domain-containing protein [Calorimonas adulescens]TZE82612.1 nucleoside recognition protein [Calorimonas adulescens]
MLQALYNGVYGGIMQVLKIAEVVIPLMIVMEILRDTKLMDKASDIFAPVVKKMGMSQQSAFPLIVGMVFGLSYSAGVIIQCSREGVISRKDFFLVCTFLVICHSVIEDTIILARLGANVFLLLIPRLVLAFLFTWFLSGRYNEKVIDRIP